MKFKRADASTMLISITEAVSKAIITHYKSIRLPPDWEKSTLAGLEDGVASSLKRNLDDSGLAGFIRQELLFKFLTSDCPLPDRGEERNLTSYPQFSDTLAVAKALVSRLNELPIQYRILVRCAAAIAKKFDGENVSIKISDQLYLVSPSEIPLDFTLRNKDERFHRYILSRHTGDDSSLKMQDNALYFEYRCSGYASDYYGCKMVRDFSDDLRAFYGVLLAHDVLDDWGFGPVADDPPFFAVNELSEGGADLILLERMESDLARATGLETSVEADRRLKTGATMGELLEPAIRMFEASERSKLTTASIWLLRANLSARAMDTVLDSTIAMEVLLGDRETSDRIGLSKLMANRCAYALGKTATERREITEFFSTFYRVRSDIVHSGRLKLDTQDRAVVRKGLELASRVLRHEVQLSSQGASKEG